MEKERTDCIVSISDRIALLSIYRDDWKYRDQTFMSYFWRLIYLSLIVSFLPNFFEAINVQPDIISKLPSWAFPVAGIICSLFGLYLGLAEIKRISSINEKYHDILKTFAQDYIVEQYSTPFLKVSLNKLLCIVAYSIVIVLALINLGTTCL